MSGEWYNYGKQVLTSTWENASRDESLIYILYLFKKKTTSNLCHTLVHFDEKFKKVQKLQLFF